MTDETHNAADRATPKHKEKVHPSKLPTAVRDANFYIGQQVVRGTLNETDPQIIECRRVVREWAEKHPKQRHKISGA